MLGFLLFAGAMHVDAGELRRQMLAISTLATLGVMASTVIVGLGLWLAAKALGFPLSLPWALARNAGQPDRRSGEGPPRRIVQNDPSRSPVLRGEALFNDGVGIVCFTAAVPSRAENMPIPWR
jgi:CPA1 family monovalent cation:H+ antiporter